MSSVLRRFRLLVGLVFLACQTGNDGGTSDPIGSIDRVRPDVRKYIDSELTSEFERKAALQFAAAMQGHIDAADSAAKMKQLLPFLLRSMDCMRHVFPVRQEFPPYEKAEATEDEIEARTFNTKERSLAYARSMKHLSGSTWSDSPRSEYSKGCDFSLIGFTPKASP